MSTQTGTQTVAAVTYSVVVYSTNDPVYVVTSRSNINDLDAAIEIASDMEEDNIGNAVVLRHESTTVTTTAVVTDFR